MSEEKRCAQCGAVLAADAPQGLCPACLLKRGFATSTGGGESNHQGARTEYVPPPPAELARYFPELEILEVVGRGGMGVVYKARQKRLDRLVALKILPPNVSRDPAFSERFSREAKALARLTHPNIVTVHDFGQTDGLFYFVMEFVDGMNLRQLLNTAKIAPKEALAIVPQICDALQFAHDKGIVHRDIKPENILIDKSGVVKIADFGLAKLVGLEAKDLTITSARDVIGTPHYMAPEQVEHPQDVDHRADIYSLGVVFYQMLTGELPIGRFAPPSRKVHIDVRLDEVVLRALEKEPEHRYQHVSQVKTEVETIVNSAGVPSAEPGGAHGAVANKLTNKSGIVRIVEILSGITFTSPLATKLINISALGFLGFLRSLGYMPLPGWHRCFGFAGFFGFFGLIGVAFMVEFAKLRKAKLSGAAAGNQPAPAKKETPAWKEYFLCALALLPMLAGWFLACVFVLPKVKNNSWNYPVGFHPYENFPWRGFFAWMADHWTTRAFLGIVLLVILAELLLPIWRRHRRWLAWTVVALVNGATLLTLIGVFAHSMQNPAQNPREVIGETIRNEVGRQLHESGASFDSLQVTVAEERDRGTPFTVSYKGLRGFKYTHGGLPDPKWPASADGQFIMQYIGGGQWQGKLGDTPFTVSVGKVDNIALPFINDPDVIGEWKSVDFVSEKSAFNPHRPTWKGDLYLKRLTFLENGKMTLPWATWTKGVVMHHGDMTASRYEIQEIDGQRYLFFEWKSGDVTILGRKPAYYVLRWSGAANTTAEDAGQTLAGLPPVGVRTQPVSGARDVEPGVAATVAYRGDIGVYLDSFGSVATSDAVSSTARTNGEPHSITILFWIPDQFVQEVVKKLDARQQLVVDAYGRDNSTRVAHGVLVAVDNQIDAATGTLKCKANLVVDGDTVLLPNQFVNVRMLREVKHGVVLVPATAVVRDQQSAFVMVIKPDQTVDVRPVTIGVIEAGVAEITGGLSPGEVVVDDGSDKLQTGTKVRYTLVQATTESVEDSGQTVAGLPPVVVETQPVSGARDVEPGVAEIRVRFSKEMTDGSWSWGTAWENSSPEIVGKPRYESDHRTCVITVKLVPGRTYGFWINSEKFQDFTDKGGRPAVPYLLEFRTKEQ